MQTESKELTRGRGRSVSKKKTENPMKKVIRLKFARFTMSSKDCRKRKRGLFMQKIESLEVQLEHIRMMQIKANIARMKYRSVCSELREKSVFYASSLKDLEDGIKQQEIEIKRLQVRVIN